MLIKSDVSPATLVTDRETLAEAVTILLSNAIKYSSPKTTITVSTKIVDHNLEIAVADQGYGIKATDLPYIFERFYRADSSRSKTHLDGYGLGLAIAKQLVTMLDGEILVTSKVGSGSTFRVRLPING